MEEIKVGEYIRTEDGEIFKVTKKEFDEPTEYYWYYGEKICTGAWQYMIKKHSPNIIDIIQEGDYVNGSKVIDIVQAPIKAVYTENQEQKLALIPIINKQIKSVLTKEQFNQVKYEV